MKRCNKKIFISWNIFNPLIFILTDKKKYIDKILSSNPIFFPPNRSIVFGKKIAGMKSILKLFLKIKNLNINFLIIN